MTIAATETARRPSAQSILEFAYRARELDLANHVGEQRKQAPRVRPSFIALESFLTAAQDRIEAREDRFRHNPWRMAGIGRYEVRNSAVLGNLFDRAVSPVAGPSFLAHFLDIVRLANNATNLPAIVATSEYRIFIEHCPTGRQTERVDLTIEGEHFLIGIEIKIDAGEGPNQLDRYLEVIRERAALRNHTSWHVIYLSPRPSGRKGDVLESSWAHIGRAAEQTGRELEGSNFRAAWLLHCFADHVRDFY